MAKLEKEILKYIQSYNTKKGLRWRVILPDGHGGQLRQQGFIEKTHAVQFATNEFKKTLMQTNKLSISVNSKMTFAEYSKLWIDQKQRDGLVEVTIRRYQDQLDQFINPYVGCFKLVELEKFHLRNFIQNLQTTDVSTYNAKSTVTLIKMIIRRAVEDDYMPLTNILTVRTPKHRPKDPRFWDHNEMIFFLNATAQSKNHKLWKFVLYSGLRAGEVAGLKWDCIHFDMKSGEHVGFIEIKRTCAQKTKKISERTKNGDKRIIPIFPQIKELLIDMKSQATGEFVFGNDESIETSHLNRLLQSELEKIPELKKVNFHGLRHTFCSFVDSTGMNRRIVAEIMGHRDLSTTNRYSHVSNQTLGFEVSKWFEKQNQQNSNKVSLVAL